MHCHKDNASHSIQPSPRQAVSFSCYFLNVLTGRKPAAAAQQLATDQGWAAFAKIRRRVPAHFRHIRVRRIQCPNATTAEIVAMVEDGRAHQAMTFTFRATPKGWRLDDCDLINAGHRPQHRL